MTSYDIVNFDTEVIEASHKIPVLVDFWAPWCGPCKILGPVLEKLASQSENQWSLKKVNVDEHQEIAKHYHIKGIPAVKLFRSGAVVAEFTGALPEMQITKWLNDNLPSELDQEAERALLFYENGNQEKAESIFQNILKQNPNHSFAAFYLGQIMLFKDFEAALEFFSIAGKDPDYIDQAGFLKKIASILLKKKDPQQFTEDPVKTIFLEAVNALSEQDFEKAIQKLIDVIMRNKAYEDEIAREACIAIFYYLGTDHELVKKYRRRFDMALY